MVQRFRLWAGLHRITDILVKKKTDRILFETHLSGKVRFWSLTSAHRVEEPLLLHSIELTQQLILSRLYINLTKKQNLKSKLAQIKQIRVNKLNLAHIRVSIYEKNREFCSISKPNMEGTPLKLENPIQDGISQIRFAPQSNNLLISSWDSNLRLYDADSSTMRLEASLGVPLLGCCFQNESAAFSIGSDMSIRRHDFDTGTCSILGVHDDLATCIEYFEGTSQVITAGLDKKISSWDLRMANEAGYSKYVGGEIHSMSLCGFYLLVAIGTSVGIYDLRNLKGPAQMREALMDYQIKSVCSFPDCRGYAVGSIDGRASLEFLNPSDANEQRCVFRCSPKSKDRRNHFVAVNDIVFHPRLCSAFVTGDNDGYTIMWDAQSKKRLYEFPRYSNSVASLSFNHGGQLLAVASSYTYQEANEKEEPPCIFVHQMDEVDGGMSSIRSSK